MKNKPIEMLEWQGFTIQVSSDFNFFNGSFKKAYGYDMVHVEVNTIAPDRAAIPITESGYKSLWFTNEEVLQHGAC